MLSTDQIAAWRALCEKATPAENWKLKGLTMDAAIDGVDCSFSTGAETTQAIQNDMELMIAARTALPILLDEVERLRQAIDDCGRGACRNMYADSDLRVHVDERR